MFLCKAVYYPKLQRRQIEAAFSNVVYHIQARLDWISDLSVV